MANIITSIASIICVILWYEAEAGIFPDGMYHTHDEEQFPSMYEDRGYKVRALVNQSRKQILLADLAPWSCKPTWDTTIQSTPDFGLISTRTRTYTEAHYPQGRYYAEAMTYEEACICPPLYKVEWKPFFSWHKIYSAELRIGKVEVEATEIYWKPAMRYQIFYESKTKLEYKGDDEPIVKTPPRDRHDDKITYLIKNFTIEKKISGIEGKNTVWYFGFPYRYWAVHYTNIETALNMINYVINLLYEKYLWVEWRIGTIGEDRINNPEWTSANRNQPCYVKPEDTWGIMYVRQTFEGPECNISWYSRVRKVTNTSFELIIPTGSWQPYENMTDNLEEIRHFNVIQWQYARPKRARDDPHKQEYVRVKFKHGAKRSKPTHIRARIHDEGSWIKYHKNFLLPKAWLGHKTKFMHKEKNIACERKALSEAKKFPHNLPWIIANSTQRYEILQDLKEISPESCYTLYEGNETCRKSQAKGICKYATGPVELSLKYKYIKPDIHENQSVLAYGEPCFVHPNVSLRLLPPHIRRRYQVKRFFFSLLFSAIAGAIVENRIQHQLDTFKELMNQKMTRLVQQMN